MRNRRCSDRRVFLTRRIGIVLLLGVLAGFAPVLHPESVSAASGVDDYPARLKNARLDALVDPWQFYSGECTSWVAWRLNSENLVPFTDYFEGAHWGNASNWSKAAASLGIPVDNNPTRGAVAWWRAGSAGSSRGHVAWVETVSDGAITIEEYNYLHAGKYDTRTISSTSSMWPSGFIHIKDTVVRNTAAPVVSGTAQVGASVTTSNGSWTATNLVYHYQWMANGKPIAGATAPSFQPTAAQLGKRLRAKVIATKAGSHNGSATSPPTGSVAQGVFATTVEPAVVGTPQVGVPLTASPGTWTPTGAFTYQWYAGPKAIRGATASTYTPTKSKLGKPIQVMVTSTLAGYATKSDLSAPAGPVAPGQFQATVAPTVTGTPQVDQVLTGSPGTFVPAGAVHLQWLADGAPITGATATTYAVTPAEVNKVISLQVTVSRAGYANAVVSSAGTTPIAPATFVNTRPPAVVGTPKVGVPLTADKGAWNPKATLTYQWVVGGTAVPGATSATFTPRPQDVGLPVVVQVLASRPGYTTAVVASAPTAATLAGVFRVTKSAAVTGRPMVGHTLHASSGSWSLRGVSLSYQWFAGTTAIPGATTSSYAPTPADAGQPIHVVVTAAAAGYTSQSTRSKPTDPVLLGAAALAKPTVSGKAILGHKLTAHVASFAPTTAVPHYHWLRGQQRIHGAHGSTYVLRKADVGQVIHVEVTVRAPHWEPLTRRSAATARVRTTPSLHARTSVKHGRVVLRLDVLSPGLVGGPSGSALVLQGHQRLGRITVVDGQGSRRLAAMHPGTHPIIVIYRGGAMETPGQITVPVTVP